MTYNSGTATDYLDLLDQLIEVVTGRHMATIAMVSGGTLYVAGEILTIDNTGATQTETAQIEILTVDGGGVILTSRIYRGGVYTVDPTNVSPNTPTGGTGSAATFTITMDATGWSLLTRQSEATTAVVAVGGTGYTNGSTDVLTVVGGVLAAQGGTAATYTATVAGGIVTSVALLSAGNYEVVPTNAVLTSVSPTGGTGCTLTVTWADRANDTMVVLQGSAGSSTDPLVGIKTYSDLLDESNLNSVYNWALFSFTSWSASFAMHEQPNTCKGFNTLDNGDLTASDHDGSFVPLRDFDATYPITWWISATGRRVTVVARTEDAINADYSQFSFGLLNPYGITDELPYPAYVAGPSDRKQVWFGDQTSAYGGLSDALMISNSTGGPAQVWAPEGEWLGMRNGSLGSESSTSATYNVANTSPRTAVWPLGSQNAQATVLQQWTIAATSGFDMFDLTPVSGATEIYRTPDTGGDLFPLYPITYCQADSASGFFRTFGEVDGVFFLHNGGAGISSEDRITQDGVAYTIFQNGTRTGPFSFMALRED